MQIITLNNISRIDSGMSFRQRIEDNPIGDCWVIQMKDISSEHLSISGKPNSISLDEVNTNQLLQYGDILFMAKGNNNFAIRHDSYHPAVAVSLFFIIRPDQNIVDPEFLTWYLNSPTAQAYFHENRLGASVGNIRKETLEMLEVELPSMDRQKQISKLNSLIRQEVELTRQYISKKESLMNRTMLNLINK